MYQSCFLPAVAVKRPSCFAFSMLISRVPRGSSLIFATWADARQQARWLWTASESEWQLLVF